MPLRKNCPRQASTHIIFCKVVTMTKPLPPRYEARLYVSPVDGPRLVKHSLNDWLTRTRRPGMEPGRLAYSNIMLAWVPTD